MLLAVANTFAAAMDAACALSTASAVATNISRSKDDEEDKFVSKSYNANAAS